MSLSDRVRPDVEAAPWVIEEIRKLEAERDAAVKALTGWSGYGYRDGYYVDDIGEYFQPFIDAAKEKAK